MCSSPWMPMDPASNVVRSRSRLNRVVLVRLDPSTLVGPTKDRAAEGVVAFTAICPHAGCEVSGWQPEQKIFECSCHYSHYNPREGASVMGGPATSGRVRLRGQGRHRPLQGC